MERGRTEELNSPMVLQVKTVNYIQQGVIRYNNKPSHKDHCCFVINQRNRISLANIKGTLPKINIFM